jgi:hypothetical protein
VSAPACVNEQREIGPVGDIITTRVNARRENGPVDNIITATQRGNCPVGDITALKLTKGELSNRRYYYSQRREGEIVQSVLQRISTLRANCPVDGIITACKLTKGELYGRVVSF